jgi:hypothetical protein
MKRSRMNKDRMKRLPSVEDNSAVPATDDDNTPITIDIEKAREEFRRLVEVKDE